MSSTRPAEADSDARYRGWTERIQRIKTETYYLFWNRRLFRAVQHMFQTNEALQKAGGDWLAPFRLAWALPTFDLPHDEFDP